MKIFSSRNMLLIFTLFCMLLCCYFLSLNNHMWFIFLLLPIFILTYLKFPHAVILIILIIRPALDLMSNVVIVLNQNISSLLSILIIALTAFEFFYKKSIVLDKISLYLLVFSVMTIPSFLASNNYIESISDFLRYISFFCMYVLSYSYIRNDLINKEQIINCIFLSSIIPITFGILQWYTKTGKNDINAQNRIYGTFVNPNVFSFYLIIIIAVTIMLLLNKNNRKKLFHIIIFIVSIACIVLSFTRGAWIGTAFFLMVLLLFGKIKTSIKVAIIGLVLLTLLFFNSLIISRFSGILESDMENSSLATRIFIWNHVLQYFIKSPVVGNGLSSFTYLSNISFGRELDAHNDYIKLLVETGLFGFLSYLYLILQSIIISIRNYFKTKLIKNEILIVLSLVLTFSIMSVADNIINMTVTQWYLWCLLGMISASISKEESGSIGVAYENINS